MAGIRTALTNLVALQESVAITDPVPLSIKKAFRMPPGAQVAPSGPFIINFWTFPDQRDYLAQGVHDYTINMQVFCYDGDWDRGAEIATAFHEALLDAWVADPRLKQGGDPTILRGWFRGGEPTLGRLEWNGTAYVGLDLFLECLIERT